jgi:hypothetical protein
MAGSQVQNQPLPTPPTDQDSLSNTPKSRFTESWNRWFLAVQKKVNVISASLVNFASTTFGAGIISSDGAGNFSSSTLTQLIDTIGSTQGDILYRNATQWTALPPGTSGYVFTSNGAGSNPSWQASSGGGGTTVKCIQVAEVQASGTDGGTATANTWNTRAINTIVVDDTGLVTLPGSSTFTIPAGTYIVQASAPAYQANNHVLRLVNVTDAINYYGTSEYTGSGNGVATRSMLGIKFVLSATKTFRFDSWVSNSNGSTNNLGGAAHITGVSETYCFATFFKIA